jgi:WhiB family redox-sensing transcriptional regulator
MRDLERDPAPPTEPWMTNPNRNCAGIDPNVFFPGKGDSLGLARAISVCHGCPTKAECLSYAIRYNQPGVWGGQSREARKRENARRTVMPMTASDHGTPSGYQKHRYRGEEPCSQCKEARAAQAQATRKSRSKLRVVA